MQNNRWNEIGNTCSKLNFFNKTKMTELEQRKRMDKHAHKSGEQLLTRNGSVMQIPNLDLDLNYFLDLGLQINDVGLEFFRKSRKI